MTMLVDLEEAKANLKQEVDDDDVRIVQKIEAASAAVLAYLKDYDFLDEDGEPDPDLMPAQVKEATLMLLEIIYSPDGQVWEPGYLPPPVMALLYPLRDPSFA